jgi:sugar/nucleoside kinase (ribokinase family)
MLKILSIGGASVDAYLNPKGKVKNVHIAGSAVNTAKNYKALGFTSKARIWVGKDGNGKDIINNLVKNKIVTVYDALEGERSEHKILKNNKVVVENSDHLPQILREEDEKMIKSANWIHLSGLNSTPTSINRVLLPALEAKAIPVTWSPGKKQIEAGFHSFEQLLSRTVVLTLNKGELLKFTRRRTLERAIQDILHTGVKILVVTDHASITRVISYNERFTITPPHGKITDLQGVGDCWASTFTAYAVTEFDIPKAMQLATFHTKMLLEHEGADSAFVSKNDLEKKFKRVEKKYLVHVHKYM